MHIKRLEIENLRSIEDASLDLNVPGVGSLEYTNVNVLLGGNGLGKTSVLRAAALSVLGPLLSSSSGFVSEGMVRRPPESRGFSSTVSPQLKPANVTAYIDCSIENSSDLSIGRVVNDLVMRTDIRSLGTAERLDWKVKPSSAAKLLETILFNDEDAGFFIVGYGASRRVESSVRVDESARVKSRLRRYERVAGLFEDHLGLMPLSYWLPEYMLKNKGRYTQVFNLINDLLPEACRLQKTPVLTTNGREHLFEMNGVALPFRALSDGYRAYIGWIGDMLFHVCMGIGKGLKLREIQGVVLVDEIDLHLHPEWQRVVVPILAKALPYVQFIVTTHSPLVVGSLEAANLFVLTEENGATVIKRLPERVRGKSAEQILLSPYFGLESTRALGTATQLNTLARKAASGDKNASLKYLEILANGTLSNNVESYSVPEASTKKRSTNKVSSRKDAIKHQAPK